MTVTNIHPTQEKNLKALLKLGAVSVGTAAGLLVSASALADEARADRLGDHPAIVVQRLHKTAGYDYASKFYAHPAGLHLHAEAPRDAAQPAATAQAESKVPAARAVARQSMATPKASTRVGG